MMGMEKFDTETVKGRMIKNLRVGDKIKMPYGRGERHHMHRYEVVGVYQTYIRCRDLGVKNMQEFESFTLGDLVLNGFEPCWDEEFGEDPNRHMEQIEKSEKRMRKKRGAYDKWDDEKITKLLSLFSKGHTYKYISSELNVSMHSLTKKLNRMGLRRHVHERSDKIAD